VHCCVVSRLCYINFLCSREIYLLLIECKISICEWDIQSVICHFHRCPHNNEGGDAQYDFLVVLAARGDLLIASCGRHQRCASWVD
jgi:hypothetical protein